MLHAWFQRRRRRRLLGEPLPGAWRETLQQRVPLYRLLAPNEQARLEKDLRIFIAEKNWEGCGGLVLDDEMRVTIAAWACLLVLGLEHDFFARLKSILVYPSGYLVPAVERGGIMRPAEARLGEAWYRGPVVLSWEDVQRAVRPGARENVVLHEFAHQIDMLDRQIDGTPPLPDRDAYRSWAEVMTAEYEQLRRDWHAGRRTLLDPYGTADEAEFFAVATECFFMQPRELADKHPRLYAILRDYYHQDPAARVAAAERGASGNDEIRD